MTDNYAGLDYGNGQTNIDKNTGIRYGVISQNTVGQIWYDRSAADYGKPTCPECGHEFEPDNAAPCPAGDFYCPNCKKDLQSEDCYPDEASGFYYDKDGYKLNSCLDTDIVVLQSPFFTYAQFCSPCVPGAGNLDHSLDPDVGIKTYCLGHDWFDEDEAPYRVWSVATEREITVVETEVVCSICDGRGKRSLADIAKVRGCRPEDVKKEELYVQWVDDTTFNCNACKGLGHVVDKTEQEL